MTVEVIVGTPLFALHADEGNSPSDQVAVTTTSNSWSITSSSLWATSSEWMANYDHEHPDFIRVTPQDFYNSNITFSGELVTIVFPDGRTVVEPQKSFYRELDAETFGFGEENTMYSDDEYQSYLLKLQSIGALDKWTKVTQIADDEPGEEFYCLMARQALPSPPDNEREGYHYSDDENLESNLRKIAIYADLVKIPVDQLKCSGHSIQEELEAHAKSTVDFWEGEINKDEKLKEKMHFDRRQFQAQINSALKKAVRFINDPAARRVSSSMLSSMDILKKKNISRGLQIDLKQRSVCDRNELTRRFMQAVQIFQHYPSKEYLYTLNYEGCRADVLFSHSTGRLSGSEMKELEKLKNTDSALQFLESRGTLP